MKKGKMFLGKLVFGLFVFVLLAAIVSADYTWKEDAYKNYNYSVAEDSVYYHNLTLNVSGSGASINFLIDPTGETPFLWNGVSGTQIPSWIFMNDSTGGDFEINAQTDNQTGFFGIPFKVSSGGAGSIATFYFNISPVNDPPYWLNLNSTLYASVSNLFSQIFNIADEENDYPYNLNTTFVNCSVAPWSSRNSSILSNCSLFNILDSSKYSFDPTAGTLLLNFTPTKNDIGSYLINFTVTDNVNTSRLYLQMVNKSNTTIVNLTVLDANTAPVFTSICGQPPENSSGSPYIEMNETETYSCCINVTDIGESTDVTFGFLNGTKFSSNLTWFSAVNTSLFNPLTYNGSICLSITPIVKNVGNWSINITANDTGATYNNGLQQALVNITRLQFLVKRHPHNVSLSDIGNVSYSNNAGTSVQNIIINATDNDLLIPDKSYYNETLSFNATVNGVVNENFVNVTSLGAIQNTNMSLALINVNPARKPVGKYSVNITVSDLHGTSNDSKTFNITLIENAAPVWNISNKSFVYWEGNNTYMNLSQNVSSTLNLTFNYSLGAGDSFPSFGLNASTGVINFTSVDVDVGEHLVTITVTDSLKSSSLPVTFNFTINNVNDTPFIRKPLPEGCASSVSDSNYNYNPKTFLHVLSDSQQQLCYNPTTSTMTGFENLNSTIYIIVEDADLRCGSCGEDIILNTTGGPKGFNFIRTSSYNYIAGNFTFSINFKPSKNDTQNGIHNDGIYNISLTAYDKAGLTDSLNFTLNLTAVNNAPVFNSSTPANFTYAVGDTFYWDTNATDVEDGDESRGNLTYSIINLSSANFLTINSTTGVMNVALSQSDVGKYRFNVSVNDSLGAATSWVFNLTTYDSPRILLPQSGYIFNLSENKSNMLNFTVNHTVGDLLNYSVYINNVLKNSTSGAGNGTNQSIVVLTNFTDETCGRFVNLTLNVSNAKFSNVSMWNINITHVNEPLTFYKNISNSVGSASLTLNLSAYFRDADASDPCHNQTVTFNVTEISNPGSIAHSVVNDWTSGNEPYVTFSSSSSDSVIGNFSITGHEYNESGDIINNATSNNFTVELVASTVVVVPTSSGGGGGGGSTTLAYIKIILPGPISANTGDKIVVPIQITNPSQTVLSGIKLSSSVAKDGVERKDFPMTFDRDSIASLAPGQSAYTNLTVNIDTSEIGAFELTINAAVTSPKYKDWGKIYITVGEDIQKEIVFTEKLIVENPECLELKEMVDDARRSYIQGDYLLAQEKIENATNACKNSISQRNTFLGSPKYANIRTILYVAISSIIALMIGLIYYYYKRVQIGRMDSLQGKV